MIAIEHGDGAFWTIFDFYGWHPVNMVPAVPDLYTKTMAEH